MNGAKKIIPDTNILLRYLLQDHDEHYHEAEAFFEKVRNGETEAIVLESVLVETVYVLNKYYAVPREAIADTLKDLLRYKGVSMHDREKMMKALDLYALDVVEMVDCLLAVHGREKGSSVLTFDKKLMKLCKK